ncbi:hypothetical protein K439DRAFT_1612366 [Ramaria rubella]|nr:hypothetical protein K439DRAFT_1612366 [Ramaria rubella]
MVKEWAKFLASGVIGITCEVPPKVAKWDIYKATAHASWQQLVIGTGSPWGTKTPTHTQPAVQPLPVTWVQVSLVTHGYAVGTGWKTPPALHHLHISPPPPPPALSTPTSTPARLRGRTARD